MMDQQPKHSNTDSSTTTEALEAARVAKREKIRALEEHPSIQFINTRLEEVFPGAGYKIAIKYIPEGHAGKMNRGDVQLSYTLYDASGNRIFGKTISGDDFTPKDLENDKERVADDFIDFLRSFELKKAA